MAVGYMHYGFLSVVCTNRDRARTDECSLFPYKRHYGKMKWDERIEMEERGS